MPNLYQHTINKVAELAVWHIQEPLSFFSDKLEIDVPQMHPEKQLQYLASRLLLKNIFPGFPISKIQKSASGKPFLPDQPLSFSISHCGKYAAAIVSKNSETGIDVEIITPKATRLLSRFLSEQEQGSFFKEKDTPLIDQQSTLCWSVKETMFKWYGKGEVDFRKHLQIIDLPLTESGIVKTIMKKNQQTELNVHYQVMGEVILTWTNHPVEN